MGSQYTVYCSIYRKKQFPDIYRDVPLLKAYGENTILIQNMWTVCLDYEIMFYLRMVRCNSLEFDKLWLLIKHYSKKYNSIKCLLECNIDINCKNKYGGTVLVYAFHYVSTEIVSACGEELINARCDLNNQDNMGDTALTWASFHSYTKIVEKIIDARCDVNVQNISGYTALIIASYYGHIETVEKLINARCDVNTQNKYGKTALDYAIEKGHQQIIDLLMAA